MNLTELEENTLLLDYAMEASRTSNIWVVLFAQLFGTEHRISTVYDSDTVYTVYQSFGVIYK